MSCDNHMTDMDFNCHMTDMDFTVTVVVNMIATFHYF